MTHEIYNAMKSRLTIVPLGEGTTSWKFYNIGLNKGIDRNSGDYIDPIYSPVSISFRWNVLQKIYRILREDHPDINARLLKAGVIE